MKINGNTKHLIDGKPYSRHPTYKLFFTVWQRCYSPKNDSYRFYGNRGVVICDEWLNDHYSFCVWAIEKGWRKGLQLDKDILGNGMIYSPSTCCFVTGKINCNNKLVNRRINIGDISYTLMEATEKFNLPNYSLLQRRLNFGWEVNTAIKMPPKKYGVKYFFDGKNMTLLQWSEKLLIPKSTLNYRLNSGWKIEKAFTEPVKVIGRVMYIKKSKVLKRCLSCNKDFASRPNGKYCTSKCANNFHRAKNLNKK